MSSPSPILPETDALPELNPELDRAKLAEMFRRDGRIHIPNIFTDATARRLFYALEHETPWRVAVNEGAEHAEYEQLPPAEMHRITTAAWDRARSRFQFVYHRHRLTHSGEPYPNPSHYFGKFVSFLTSPELFGFMRDVTGMNAITWINGQATLYKPLDFLTLHDDNVEDDNRLVAYVFNMTPNWRPDWGGALQFYDSREHIEEGYLPTFNALNMFRVPKLHSVSQVAPFGGLRYAITGWLHWGTPQSDSTARS